MDEAIKKMMQVLGCTEAEAREVVEADAAIDKGEKLFELNAEQKKASKKARSTGTKKRPTAYKFEKRERKPNEDKRAIMNALMGAMEGWHHDEENPVADVADLNLSNPERQIDFQFNGTNYSITLTAHRPPKG